MTVLNWAEKCDGLKPTRAASAGTLTGAARCARRWACALAIGFRSRDRPPRSAASWASRCQAAPAAAARLADVSSRARSSQTLSSKRERPVRVAERRHRCLHGQPDRGQQVLQVAPPHVQPPDGPRLVGVGLVAVRDPGWDDQHLMGSDPVPTAGQLAPPGPVRAGDHDRLIHSRPAGPPVPGRVREVPGVGHQQHRGRRPTGRLGHQRSRQHVHPLARETVLQEHSGRLAGDRRIVQVGRRILHSDAVLVRVA